MNESDLLWISLLLTFTFISCQIQIERKNFGYYFGSGFFYCSNDYFNNPLKSKNFCTARNADCRRWNDCFSYCCGNNKKFFLSYQQASQCMRTSTSQNIIPSIDDYYVRIQTHTIYLPNAVTGTAGKCTQTKLTAYDMKYGHGSSFNQQTLSKFRITKKVTNSYNLKGTLHVERQSNTTVRIRDFYQSSDFFTNLDNQQEFCTELQASCYNNCNKCKCNTFVSYRNGCLNGKTASKKLGLDMCLKVQGHRDSIVFIQQKDFEFGTRIKLQMPSTFRGNHIEWSCVVDSTKSINALTAEEELSAENRFSTNFSSVYNNHLCLQCKSFTCDLSIYSGKLLKLGIKCWNEHSLKTIDTCFAFSMSGKLTFNETNDAKATDNSYKKGSREVERTLESQGTRDYYTNPDRHKDFCSIRRGVCTSEAECSKCRCLSDFSTFVSYKQGCMNTTKYSQLNETHCLDSDAPLVVSNDFKNKRCVYLEKPSDLMKDGLSCGVNRLSYINPINGQEENLGMEVLFIVSTSKVRGKENKFCLQCDSSSCELSELSRRLLKLGVHCMVNETTTSDWCIAFKMGGMYAVNATLTPTTHNSSSSLPKIEVIIIIISALVLLLLVFSAMAIVRQHRTKAKQ